MDLGLVAEPDLGLGRMDVHVDERGIDLEEKESERMAVAHEQVAVGA